MPKDPDTLVDLTTARTAFEAEMIAESLRAQGIPAEAFTTVGSMLQWDIAGTQPMRVQVRRQDVDKAAEALRAIRAESVDLDWDEVDTGSSRHEFVDLKGRCLSCRYDLAGLPNAERCPECGTPLTRAVQEAECVPDDSRHSSAPALPMAKRRWLMIACGVVLAAGAGVAILDATLGQPRAQASDQLMFGGIVGGIGVVIATIGALSWRRSSP